MLFLIVIWEEEFSNGKPTTSWIPHSILEHNNTLLELIMILSLQMIGKVLNEKIHFKDHDFHFFNQFNLSAECVVWSNGHSLQYQPQARALHSKWLQLFDLVCGYGKTLSAWFRCTAFVSIITKEWLLYWYTFRNSI